jgi:hypothetical protein
MTIKRKEREIKLKGRRKHTLGIFATKAKREKAHPWGALQQKQRKRKRTLGVLCNKNKERESDGHEEIGRFGRRKVCAPPRYVAIERKNRASMRSKERTSTPGKNKRVLLREESTGTLGMHYNKEEKESDG